MISLALPPLISISYIPEGNGYRWIAYRNNQRIHEAWNHSGWRVAERDAKAWLRGEGLL